MAARLPIIGRFDYAPSATISGGSFLASAPATNMLIPRPQLTAIATFLDASKGPK